MPPQRRNQGLALPHQSTPPRASNRQRQPIARAAVASRGRGREIVDDDQAPPSSPLPNDGSAIDGDDRDAAANISISSLPTMWFRRVESTSTIFKRKQQER